MSFITATQPQRTEVAVAVQVAEICTRDTRNGANLRGIRNDYTDAEANAALQRVANALLAAGFTAA
jgi:hypothetical protein